MWGMTHELAAEILAYYDEGGEDTRLADHPGGRLEFLRTQDILRRVLPPAPTAVLDVGGGSGVHARWLAADGYRVRLVDPVPRHVGAAAALPGVSAVVGDARTLAEPDAAYDVVLLLGPLYHLLERADRVRALAEARRVCRPGGLVAAATISRYAPLYDGLLKGWRGDWPGFAERVLASGANVGDAPGFTTAYFHHPDEVPAEFLAAGLADARRYAVEGGAWLLGDLGSWLDGGPRQAQMLTGLRLVEEEPSLYGVSSHLLTVARCAV
jgi:SAM-dependent methyltransferase